MKKVFLFLSLASIALNSCREEDQMDIVPEVSIETQNSYDTEAIQVFLETHYLDAKGRLQDYKEGDTAHVKLASLNPVLLPSGVVYIMRAGAQPTPGTTVGDTDIIRLMSTTMSYVASKNEDKVAFRAAFTFRNTISDSGVPEVDPIYYRVKQEVLDKATAPQAKDRRFYEMEGFQEAIRKFKAYDIPDESNFNLQGVIIVPSRAAYARDSHADIANRLVLRNRSFVFNFQLYKTTTRP